jgi:hypothetical protein
MSKEERMARLAEIGRRLGMKYAGIVGVVFFEDERERLRFLPKKDFLMMVDAGRKVKLIAEVKTVAELEAKGYHRWPLS